MKKDEIKIENKISYKLFMTICISSLMFVLALAFVLYSYAVLKSNGKETASKEAEFTSQRVVSHVDEIFSNIRQYYLYSASNESIVWFLNNEMTTSDYDKYMKISSALNNASIYPGFVGSYAIINFDTADVVSSKGIFSTEEMINYSEVLNLYNENSTITNKGNYFFKDNGSQASVKDADYRLTIDTKGIDFVLNLPTDNLSSNGMILININQNSFEKWIGESLHGSDEEVAVVDDTGRIIYCTNDELGKICSDFRINNKYSGEAKLTGGSRYSIKGQYSDYLGWSYYIAYDDSVIFGPTSRYIISLLIVMLVFLATLFFVLRVLLYKPVDELVREIATDDGEAAQNKNELDYLAGRFRYLRDNQESMARFSAEKKKKLIKLFEHRLMRSEVRSEEEWNEYSQALNLINYPVFAVIVSTLNLRGDEREELDIDEDALCLDLIDNIPDTIYNLTWLPLIYDSCTMTAVIGAENEAQLTDLVTVFYDSLNSYSLEKLGYSILMGVSETHENKFHIGRAYHEGVYALTSQLGNKVAETEMDVNEYSIRSQEDNIRPDCHFYLKSATNNTSIEEAKYYKDINIALKNMDKDQCYRIIDDFAEELKKLSDWKMIILYTYGMIDTILLNAQNNQIQMDILLPDGVEKLYHSITEAGDAARIRKNIKSMLIDPILKAKGSLLEDTSYQMMERIEMILSKTKGNVTLNECAEILEVSTVYIWKVLKAERNKTFSEYQEEIKIEEAKRLLVESDLSVAQIAEELGYTNAQNFIRFFSKATGLTPGKYRKLL